YMQEDDDEVVGAGRVATEGVAHSHRSERHGCRPLPNGTALEEPSHRDSMAYVTVLSTDSYLDGVLVLNESLRLRGSIYRLYALVGSNVSKGVRSTLARAGIPTISSQPLDITEEIVLANLESDYHR